MRIAFIYPPIRRNGKLPLLSQNRHFRFSSSDSVRIFPIVLASAATYLKHEGHDVLWLDGVNERLSMEDFIDQLKYFKPDICINETKAPILKDHWLFLDGLKELIDTKTILVGDHVSVYPEESMKNCSVDFIIVKGDYDFILKPLVDCLDNTGDMPQGIYYRDGSGEIKYSGKYKMTADLDDMPFIDRNLTKWRNYGEAYLLDRSAYILTGRGCGVSNSEIAGRCTFCIWQFALWGGSKRLRSPKNVVDEIKILVENHGVKEVFDDNESGAVWNLDWLKEFNNEMEKAGLIGKVSISSNARADSFDKETCEILRDTGYRLLKVGVESASDITLQRINKDEKIDDIIRGIKCAKDHGLKILMTIMMGYPWETENDAERTYEVAKDLLLYKSHMGDCLQCSLLISYPGSPLYRQAIKNGWLNKNHKEGDYESYNMAEPLFNVDYDPMKWCNKIWKLHTHPRYLWRTFWQIKSLDDLKMLWHGARSLLGHTIDF
jgi:radical SAM superfamily enzyme YgiQ (UPF0313 family)|tara:strand:- start:2492 stop:3964 length:1473 start_codon:yes stop_codon:yes gene_type:complete